MWSANRIRHVILTAGFTALATSAMTVAAPGTIARAASSCASPNGQHCYAEENTATRNQGAYGEITANCLYFPKNSTSASVTNEIWDGQSGKYWTEAGVTSGQGGNGYDSRRWFWADDRPGYGYYEHYPNISSAGSGDYGLEIYYVGNGSWHVLGGNNYSVIGISSSQPAGSTGDVTGGTEYMGAANSGIRDAGSIQNMQWRDTKGTWHLLGKAAQSDNFGPGHYINGTFNSSTSTESWSGPC
jgi:hypothetical protein